MILWYKGGSTIMSHQLLPNIATITMRLRLFKRLFLCDITFLLFAGLTIVLAKKIESSVTRSSEQGAVAATNKNVPQGNCSCGGFPTRTPAAGEAPIISQTPGLIVPVDDGGEETCRTLCFALAQATRAKGPAILCSRLKTAHELTLSVFHKVDPRPWKYSDITAPEPLCCKDHKAKLCPSVLKARTPPLNASVSAAAAAPIPPAAAAPIPTAAAAPILTAASALLPADAAVPLRASVATSLPVASAVPLPASDTKKDTNVKSVNFAKE